MYATDMNPMDSNAQWQNIGSINLGTPLPLVQGALRATGSGKRPVSVRMGYYYNFMAADGPRRIRVVDDPGEAISSYASLPPVSVPEIGDVIYFEYSLGVSKPQFVTRVDTP